MSRLHITLLGAFQVTLDGEPLTAFGTDKARALLAYLAVEAHRPHQREHLAGLLWSDQNEKKALHSLRQSLSTLRKQLNDDQADHPFLLIDRDRIQFNLESDHWLDIADFNLSLARGLPKNQHGQAQQRPNIRRLQYAISLYRGNFLDQLILRGSPLFDEWAILQREMLTRQAVEAMCFLIDYHERRCEFEQACKIAEQIVALVPWEENAHQVVMRMLAQAGQWSAVEVQYQNIQRYLADELGVEPSAETVALMDEIRQSAKRNIPLGARYRHCQHNLPLEKIPFVGRQSEMIALTELLAAPTSRCITLTGPGGIGKSRLALQVAQEQIGLFEHGVFFVPLTAIHSVDLLTTSIAENIGFSFYSSQDPQELLVDHLRQKNILLVLDNFEHLLTDDSQACELVVSILSNAPEVIILATSRQPLNLQIEQIIEVVGLTYPTGVDSDDFTQPEAVFSYSALQLFNQVARRVNPNFSLAANQNQVVKICQLIEGLPLGIELSATWVRGYEINEIASQIEQDLDFLATTMRDVPDRHRSLRSVFNHSWDLLSAAEKSVFQKLSVFQGSFSRAAAEEITGVTADQMLALIDQSLLRRTEKDRFNIHNLLRQFAFEKLEQEPNDYQTTHERHGLFFAHLLHDQETALYSGNPIKAQNTISLDIDNIRAGWKWAYENLNVPAIALAAKGLGRFYDMRSWFVEGCAVFTNTANSLQSILKPSNEQLRALAIVTTQLGWFEVQLGKYQAAVSLLEGLIPEFRPMGLHQELSAALNVLGSAFYDLGEFEKSKEYFNQSVSEASQVGALAELAFAYSFLGNISRIQGEFSEAKRWFEQSLGKHQQLDDKWGLAKALNNLGSMAGISGDYPEAENYFQESLSIRKELGDQSGIAGCLHNLSIIAYIREEYPKTKQLRQESLAICREIGYTWGISTTLKHLGDVDKALGDLQQAKMHYLESLEISEKARDRRSIAFTLNGLGKLSLLQRDFSEAKQFFKQALTTAHDLKLDPLTIDILVGIAELWMEENQYDPAYHLLLNSLAQPGIEKQTQDKAEHIKNQIQPLISSALSQQTDAAGEGISLPEITIEIIKTLP